MAVLRSSATMRGENFKTVGEFTVTAGQSWPFVLSFGLSHAPPPAPVELSRSCASPRIFGKTGPAGASSTVPGRTMSLGHLSHSRRLPMRRPAVGGRADNFASRIHRRLAQLGLSVLLVARRHTYFARTNECRILRGSAELARLAPARGRRKSSSNSNHVWLAWRTAANGMGGALAARICQFAACTYWKRRLHSAPARYFWRSHGRASSGTTRGIGCQRSGLGAATRIVRAPGDIWREPDEGLWEVRSSPEHFIHSKAMAWLAFDRAIRSAEAFDLPGPVDHWREVRAASIAMSANAALTQSLAALCALMGAKSSTPAC